MKITAFGAVNELFCALNFPCGKIHRLLLCRRMRRNGDFYDRLRLSSRAF